jgi:hypothetical protein
MKDDFLSLGFNPDEEPPRLSAAGLARKSAMLEDLQAALLRRRKRRLAIRWGSAAAISIITLSMVPWVARPLPRETAAPSRETLLHVQVEWVHDQPDILARTAIVTSPIPPEILVGDEELLSLLAKAHRPSGLIRVGGKVMLTDNRNHPTRP